MTDLESQHSNIFSNEEICFITKIFIEGKSTLEARRSFRNKFYANAPRKVPKLDAFYNVKKRLQERGSAHPQSRNPRKNVSEDDKEVIEKVKQFFHKKKSASIREASITLKIGYGTVWKILRKKLNWKFYRPHRAQVLSEANKQARLSACEFWLTFPESWFEKVIWTDEKWFVLNSSPHSKNDGYWSPVNNHEIVECKKSHGAKVMAWVGIIDGRCLPVVWFSGSVNGEVYLNEVLKGTVWPAVKSIATRRQYWYQQDGASSHVTEPCLTFLKDKFDGRIISRNTEHHWPPYSPDLSPLDFSFWSQATKFIHEIKPNTIEDLKNRVEDFAAGIPEEQLRKMVRHTRKRALLCVQEEGGHFEHKL